MPFVFTATCWCRKTKSTNEEHINSGSESSDSGTNEDTELLYVVRVIKDNKKMNEISHSEKECLDRFAMDLKKGDHARISDKLFLNDQIQLLSFIRNREISRKNFTVGSALGKGNFGTVYNGEARGLFYGGSKTPVAMKTIQDVTNHNDTDCFLAEIKLMSNLNMHCNLVNMLGSYTSSIQETGEVWILLELCEFGDLKTFVTKNKDLFTSH